MNELSSKDYSLMSTEVAEMVEKDHDKLLRDIRRYTNQMSDAKIGESDFWIETTYMNDRGKTYPCYLITKKGCEFIAHKMTGAKGTVFTARYINRFHEMEEHIKQQMPKPELEQKKEPTYLLSTVPCPRANLFYRRYTSARIRKEKLLGEGTLQKLRQDIMVSSDSLGKICVMLRCDIGDVVESIPTDEEKIKYF